MCPRRFFNCSDSPEPREWDRETLILWMEGETRRGKPAGAGEGPGAGTGEGDAEGEGAAPAMTTAAAAVMTTLE